MSRQPLKRESVAPERLSFPMQRLAAELHSADARLARAIAALARAEKAVPPGRALYAARRHCRAAGAAEARAGAAVMAVVERVARTRASCCADVTFKLHVLARLAGVDYLPKANETVDRRLLRALLADAQRLHGSS